MFKRRAGLFFRRFEVLNRILMRSIFSYICIHIRILMRSALSADKTPHTNKEVASRADVLRGSSRVPAPRAGTRDEPLRTSAWEANKEEVYRYSHCT